MKPSDILEKQKTGMTEFRPCLFRLHGVHFAEAHITPSNLGQVEGEG